MSASERFGRSRPFTNPLALLGSAALVLGALACTLTPDRDDGVTGQPMITSASASSPGVTGVSTDTDGGGVSVGGSGSSGGDPSGDPSGGDPSGDPSGGQTTTGGNTGDDTMPNPGGLPNGADCDNDGQCASNHCFQIPIIQTSGLCSECETESDCMLSGAGIACAPDPVLLYAVCTDGEAGSFCETENGCAPGLFCAELISGLQGILPNTCGDCLTDNDCPGLQLCTPTLDIQSYSGWRQCVTPGSVANNEPCPTDGGGDAVCSSGHCNVTSIPDFDAISVGLCGECTSDADCPGGTCQEGVLDLENPQGTQCG